MVSNFRNFLIGSVVLLGVSCEKEAKSPAPRVEKSEGYRAPEWKASRYLGYEVVRELPHDVSAFTQGLLLSDGDWMESTGGFGATSIRRVEKQTGKVLQKKTLAENYFGEGLAELGGKLFQLTWQNKKGFVYDAKTLMESGSFSYAGEGWGLTTDGESLIMSDGTDRLRYLDPKTFGVWREVSVRLNGRAVDMLNELEFVEGEIFANVWHTDVIVRINPVDGEVVGVIDLRGISAKEDRTDPEHVLNGIAYDAVKKELFVTGKCWPKIYQIKLISGK